MPICPSPLPQPGGSFCFSVSEESSSPWPSSEWMEQSPHPSLHYLQVAMCYLKGPSSGAKPRRGQVWEGLSGGGIIILEAPPRHRRN